MNRPLQRLADFARFEGVRVRIRMVKYAARARYSGRLVGTEGDEVLLDIDGETHRLRFQEIERANLQPTLEEYQRQIAGSPKKQEL